MIEFLEQAKSILKKQWDHVLWAQTFEMRNNECRGGDETPICNIINSWPMIKTIEGVISYNLYYYNLYQITFDYEKLTKKKFEDFIEFFKTFSKVKPNFLEKMFERLPQKFFYKVFIKQ